jgi:hypothetical protein
MLIVMLAAAIVISVTLEAACDLLRDCCSEDEHRMNEALRPASGR